MGLHVIACNDRAYLLLYIWVFSYAGIDNTVFVDIADQHVSTKVRFMNDINCCSFIYAIVLYRAWRTLWLVFYKGMLWI